MLDANQQPQVLEAMTALQETIFKNNVAKGWWEKRDIKSVDCQLGLLMLIVSEAAEGCEEIRKGMPKYYTNKNLTNGVVPMLSWERPLQAPPEAKPEGIGSELADIVIRCFDMAGGLGLNLGECVVAKMRYNETREHRHGGKLA